jgi:Uma2 family endonuclease
MKISTSTLQNSFGKYLKLASEGNTIYIEKNQKPVAVLKGIGEEDRFYLREDAAEYEPARRYSYEEFLELTGEEESEKQYELIDGQIYVMSSPFFAHQVAVNEIFGQFYNWFKVNPCRPLTAPFDVKLYNEAESFNDDPNVVQPDILVICDPEMINTKGSYDGIPTLVVEVLSKSTQSKDMILKSNLYMRSGIAEYWIVDTDNKQVIVYVFENRKLTHNKVYSKPNQVVSTVFEGLIVATDDVFVE